MRKVTLLFAVLLSLVGVTRSWAQDAITVYGDADYSSDYVPFDGYDADAAQQDQMIFPESVLTALEGKIIKSMTFYYKKNEASGTNVGNWIVSLGSTTATTLTALDTTTPLTQVYSGAITPNTDDKTITVTFDEGYAYDGGNLLVEFNHPTASGYKKFTFWCSYITPAPAYSKGATRTYLPKTTFTYEEGTGGGDGPALVVKDGVRKLTSPYTYSFGLTTAGTTKTFTLSNPGTEALGVSVSGTGNFGATLSATTIAAGGEVTLTLTMPEATSSSEVTITPNAVGLDPFVINVSGTIRDANKVYLDFADGKIPEGWTSVAIGSSASSYGTAWSASTGYISQSGSSSGYEWAFTSPKMTFVEGETIFFETAKYSSSSWYTPSIKVQYSTDGSTWTIIGSAYTDDIYGTWTLRTVTIPVEDVKYIRFSGWYVHLRNIYGGELPLEPKMVVTQPASLDYGVITEATAKTFTIANTGRAELKGINVTSSNSSIFAVTGAPTSLAAGESAEVTITMAATTFGALNSAITVSATDMESIQFTVSGAVLPEGLMVVDFETGLPDKWNNVSNYWTFNNGVATGKNKNSQLITPKLNFTAGDLVAIKAQCTDSDTSDYLQIYGSNDNGSTWTAYDKKIYGGSNGLALMKDGWGTIVLSDIPAEVDHLKFIGYYVNIDEIAGLTYAPVLEIYRDGQGVAETSYYDFGECTADASVTYNISNYGGGTITITNVAITGDGAAAYSTNWTESVAVPFDLVITRTYDSERVVNSEAIVTVTTTEGNFVINVSGSDKGLNAPELAVSAKAIEFGKLVADKTETVTVTNEGTGTMTVDIDSDSEDFVVSPASLSEIGAGESKDFTVTFKYGTPYGEKSGNITITPTYDKTAVQTVVVSATAKDPNVWSEDFSSNVLPDGWITTGSSWSFSNGEAVNKYSYGTSYYLSTPSLTVASSSDALVFDYTATANYVSITIEMSKDGGDWTSCSTTPAIGTLNTGDSGTATITGLEPGNYKFRFKNDDYTLDNFEGFKLNANDPQLAVYSDAEATDAIASGTAQDFGWVDSDATATYYIKNKGTGTLTIESITSAEGFTVATAGDAMTVAAGAEPLALTVMMPAADNLGAHSGTVTVTTDGGTFTIPVSGLVRDADKFFVDFSVKGAQFPAGWSTGGWSVSENTAKASGTLQTMTFIAAAGEKLYVEAISTGSSYSTASFSCSYSTDEGMTWNEAGSIESQLNTSTYTTISIADIADAEAERNVLLRFYGSNVSVRRIYGFTAAAEPVLTTTATDFAFGWQTAESDYQSFTISNEGTAKSDEIILRLNGFQVNVEDNTTTEFDYSILVVDSEDNPIEVDESIFGEQKIAGLEPGETITVKVKQLYNKDNLGLKSDVLVISPYVQYNEIQLTGATRDPEKYFEDFESYNFPSEWTVGSNWRFDQSTDQLSYGSWCISQNSSTPTSFMMTPMYAEATDQFTFQVARYSTYYTPTLQVRYTLNGGITWSDYIDFSDQITSTDFVTLSLPDILNGALSETVVLEFSGSYVKLDDLCGFTLINAPMLSLTANGAVVTTGSTKAFGDLTADGTATYTLTNTGVSGGNLISTVSTTGAATVAISTSEAEGVTINGNKVTLQAGKSATITLTLPYAAPYGEKVGDMIIDSEGWVGDMIVQYTATTIDPSALYIDFADNKKPAGWYNTSWTFSNGYAQAPNSDTAAELITEQFEADAENTTLSFDAWYTSSSSWTTKSLTVYTSTDRVNWDEGKTFELTTASQTVSLDALTEGKFYVKFVGSYVAVDNIKGLKAVGAPAHDLFFVSVDTPEGSYIPGSEYTATVRVVNLRAESETVAAELFIKDAKAGELTEQVIALDETKTFTLTGIVPEEGKHQAYVKVYNSNIAIETQPVTFTSAHNRQLAITGFSRTSDAEVAADENNEFTATFDVTVKNTGSVELAAEQVSVTIVDAEGNPYETVAATKALALEGETTLSVTVKTAALEGGVFTFKVQEDLQGTTYATAQTVSVIAFAPKFALYQGAAPVVEGSNVSFGLVSEATTYSYSIKNEGTKAMELVSIAVPEGFTVTALTDDNKLVAANGTLDIDVTLLAGQGIVGGDLVITYMQDELTEKTFALTLSGRSLEEGTWTEDFAAGTLPLGWVANNWTIGTFSSYENKTTMALAPSSSTAGTLVTPCLTAKEGEVLTWDAYFNWYDEAMTVEYSADEQASWTKIYDAYKAQEDFGSTRYTHKEMSFTAPADGNYYLRFTSTYQNGIDNFAGFQLNLPDHIMAITASSIPTSGSYSPTMKATKSFNATVTVKESRGVKEENVVAKVYMGEEVIGTSEAVTVEAGGTKLITITATPTEAATEGAQMHIEVEWAGETLKTAAETRYVAEFVILALTETEGQEISTGYSAVYDEVTLTRSFVKEWNTFVAPVSVNLSEFGEDAVAYSFSGYDNGVLSFSKVTKATLDPATPYVIYVPEELKSKTFTWDAPVIYSSYVGEDNIKTIQNGATFQGTYAPIGAGKWNASGVVYGLTKEAKIAKANTEKASIKGFRAYFDLPAGAEVKALRFDGLETGVRTISADEVDGQLFDINGRKVSKTQRGIYVVNGKKVIVK